MRDALAIAAARGTAALARRRGRGGTSLPGLVADRIAPGLDARIATDLGRAALITGTNGKTTTSRLLATILGVSGRTVIANPSGANLRQAIGTVLATGATLHGRLRDRGADGVFEVDEAALPATRRAIPGALIVMTNLFRDQLDRYGETDHLVRLWRAMLDEAGPGAAVAVCVDDPRLAALVAGSGAAVHGYGLGGPPTRAATASVTSDLTSCPRCAATLTLRWSAIGHLGDYTCDSCGFSRPEPELSVTVERNRGLDGQTLRFAWADGETETVDLDLPGVGNAYNAAAAVLAASIMGVPVRDGIRALATSSAAFGRYERLEIDGRQVVLTLLKNPASLDQLADIAAGSAIDTVAFGLNDAFADGRDVSWYWDCTPTAMVAGRRFTVSGRRGMDFALRLKYAVSDAPSDDAPGLIGLFSEPTAALDRAVAETPAGGRVLVVATYTALLGLRATLVARGLVPAMPR
jgi:UDP-N-acetylmuramyl tripeptide synthase